MTLDSVGNFFLEIIAIGGGAVAMAYGLFKWLGQNWLERKFAERLEKLKHEQKQEFERHRFQINSLFSRVTKIHEKEFEVLPIAWEKLQDALGNVSSFTSPLQTWPHFRLMSTEKFEEFLEKSRLTASDKDKLRNSTNRQEIYKDMIFWYDMRDAKKYVRELHNYLVYNRIFLSKDLFDAFGEINELLRRALDKKEAGHGSRYSKPKSYTIFGEEIVQKVGKIEELVQMRLHFEDAE